MRAAAVVAVVVLVVVVALSAQAKTEEKPCRWVVKTSTVSYSTNVVGTYDDEPFAVVPAPPPPPSSTGLLGAGSGASASGPQQWQLVTRRCLK